MPAREEALSSAGEENPPQSRRRRGAGWSLTTSPNGSHTTSPTTLQSGSHSAAPTGPPILQRLGSGLVFLSGLFPRSCIALWRALASVDWRARGLALCAAAAWIARGVSSLARAAGRLGLFLGRSLVSLLRSIDWRGLGAALVRGARGSGAALLEGLKRVPGLVMAVGRGALILVRAVAIVALTLLFTTLFVGAVLLGAGHAAPGPEEPGSRQERLHSAEAPSSREARPHRFEEAPGERTPDVSIADERASRDSKTQETRRATAVSGRDVATAGGSPPTSTDPPAPPEPATSMSLSNAHPEEHAPRAMPSAPSLGLTRQGPKRASCSAGTRVSGPLLNPARLPDRGPGFERIFPHRDLSWGTDELVGAIERTAVALHDPALPPLMVGNISGPEGDQAGADPFHPARYARGQGAGRAADLLFFLVDALGRPAPAAETNIEFDAGGRSVAGVRRIYLDLGDPIPEGCHLSRRREGLTEAACPIPAGAWRVDFDRTWKLVRALLTDPVIGAVDEERGISRADGEGIRFIFVDEAVKRGILSAAREAGEPEALQEIAGILLHDPSNASTFDRFMRVDLWCTDEDRLACDCVDGSRRWNRWRAEAPIGAPAPRPPPRVAAASDD